VGMLYTSTVVEVLASLALPKHVVVYHE
jgi:hypothetical protein